MPNHSTIMDFLSVITLGQLPNVPLMWSPSELAYRLEPHDYIYSAVQPCGGCMDDVGGSGSGRGVPGVVVLGGCWEGTIPGTKTEAWIPVSQILEI